MPPAARKSTLTRQSSSLMTRLGGAVVSGALASYLGYTAWHSGGFWTGVVAVAAALLALVLGFASTLRQASCPACGYQNDELANGLMRPCRNPTCQRYLEGDTESLWLVADDRLANAPTFAVVLPDRFGWPEGCCVCGTAATRVLPVTLHVKDTAKNVATTVAGAALGRIVVKTGGGTMVTVNVPHCATHLDGAALDNPSLGGLRILFRSHRYQQQFRTHNNAPAEGFMWEHGAAPARS